MISSILPEDMRLNEEDQEYPLHPKNALLTRNRNGRKTGKNKDNKEDLECYYCRKPGHTTWNCKVRDNDLKGKVKDKGKSNVALTIEEFSDSDNDI